MKLGKPPVIQTWIEFLFDFGTQARSWGYDDAAKLLDLYPDVYTERDIKIDRQFQIEKVNQKGKHRVVEAQERVSVVRGYDPKGSRYLQLSLNGFACNLVKTETGYEGFDVLKRESLDRFTKYVELFQPVRLLSLSLNYQNLVVIPLEGKNSLDLGEYINFGILVPDEQFAYTGDMSFQLSAVLPESSDMIRIKFQEQPNLGQKVGKFRVDWVSQAVNNLSMSIDLIDERLETLHKALEKLFRQSFTDKMWQMFEPLPESEEAQE